MDRENKLERLKEELTGIKYLNNVLMGALSNEEEMGQRSLQFIYLNQIIDKKLDDILKIVE